MTDEDKINLENQGDSSSTDVATNDSGHEDDALGIPPELIEKLPKEAREHVESIFMASGPVQNPIVKKVTSEHITQMIDYREKQSQRTHKSSESKRRYTFVYTIIAAALLVGFAHQMIPENLAFFQEVLEKLIAFLLGGVGGWGWATVRSSRTHD